MKTLLLGIKGTWLNVYASALTTVGKENEVVPDSNWIRRILLAEHSPIRKIHISWKWYEIPYWVSVHFVRHKFGIEHWVKTQRTDRTDFDRNYALQSALVNHECEANAQVIMNISRKRLCNLASLETREAWRDALEQIKHCEPELFSVCVPDCIYRGWCYEMKSCGYHLTDDYQIKLKDYRRGINENHD